MLIRLYSETGLLLKPIDFKAGINIVRGKYSENKEKSGINGIGKSSLVRLISYALLGADQRFADKKYNFLRQEKHNIILEFEVAGELYEVKRNFSEPKIAYFRSQAEDFIEYTLVDLKKILMNKFFPTQNNEVFLEGNRFGTLMRFFMKDDLDNIQRVDPTKFIDSPKAQDIALVNFFLLNLPTKNLIQHGKEAEEYKLKNQRLEELDTTSRADTGGPIEAIESDRIPLEKEIELREKSLQEYNFLDTYKGVEEELIKHTSLINEKLKEYHGLNHKLKKIQETFEPLRPEQQIDINEIKKLYNEVLATFGNIVAKTLNEIIAFKKAITENRNKFLIDQERQLQQAIDQLLADMSRLEKKRSELYKRLEEKGALESIKNTYEELITRKVELGRRLLLLDQSDAITKRLGDLRVTITHIKNSIRKDLDRYGAHLHELRALFLEVLRAVNVWEGEERAYFNIVLKPKSKEEELPFKIVVNFPKEDSLGMSRLRIVVYDLMVFLNNIRTARGFPDFLIHDGVYHAVSKDKIFKALNFIYRQCVANPRLQYIVTFNNEEIDNPEENPALVGKLDFDVEQQVIATFTDSPAHMIFKRSFN